MKNFIHTILITLFTCSILFSANTDIETVLKNVANRVNIPVSDLKIEKDDLEFYGYGKFRTKLFDLFISNPLKIDPYIRTLSKTILNNADSIWAISYFPWARIDEGVRRGLIERPDETFINALPKGEELHQKLIGLLQDSYSADTTEIMGLPEAIRISIFLILTEIKTSIDLIQKGTEYLSMSDAQKIVQQLAESREDGLSNPDIESLIEQIDFKLISAGAMDLSYVLQAAMDLMRNEELKKTIKIDTKFGPVVLGSKENDQYEPLPYLLIIDFGGNDTYMSGGVSDKKHPVSIIIDYSGNDLYNGETGCGTGIAGIGFVIDFEGNDRYSAERFGLGTGIFGQGIILDLDGDDEYKTEIYGIGAGLFGTGVISDISGNDKYIGFQGCQGFGFVKGCGLLIDKEGNDTYIACDDTIRYPSAQNPEHNASLAQGMGFGIRADYTDGHSLAGGVGMLIDRNGDDTYSCGVFGQGCAYWFGAGFLIDYEGNDTYNGAWYVQGAGAHFALGVLIDSTGNDIYNAMHNMAQGAGHDFTLGVIFDYEGNDLHNAPNLSLGAGNANGMGLFIDLKGDDKYTTHSGITLGNASTASRGTIRDYMKTTGIFIDCEGKDIYSEKFAGDKKIWHQKPTLEPSLKTEIGIGIDF